jgi:hypothetical protein
MNIYEQYTDTDVEEMAFGIRKVVRYFASLKPGRELALGSSNRGAR